MMKDMIKQEGLGCWVGDGPTSLPSELSFKGLPEK